MTDEDREKTLRKLGYMKAEMYFHPNRASLGFAMKDEVLDDILTRFESGEFVHTDVATAPKIADPIEGNPKNATQAAIDDIPF